MSYNMSELYDMVDRKKAVDPAIKIWKERADKRWKKEDDSWEAKYDFEIAEEARKEKEEEERWDNMTEEEQEAQMKEWGMIDSDADDYSDEDSDSDDEIDEFARKREDSSSDDDDEEIDMEWDEQAYIEACTAESKERSRIANMTPEEKKKKAREDYDKEMKELRRKEYHRIWDDMLRCTWPRLLSYRSQMGLSNDSYQSHRYHCDRKTNQLY